MIEIAFVANKHSTLFYLEELKDGNWESIAMKLQFLNPYDCVQTNDWYQIQLSVL